MFCIPKMTAVASGKTNKLSANPFIARVCASAGINESHLDSRGKLTICKLDTLLAKTSMSINDRIQFKIAARNIGLID
jgi:hypothetical protein